MCLVFFSVSVVAIKMVPFRACGCCVRPAGLTFEARAHIASKVIASLIRDFPEETNEILKELQLI